MAFISGARTSSMDRERLGRMAGLALLFLAVGIEIIVLAAWGRDTLRVWIDPETHGYGDFKSFYGAARTFSLNNVYSPGLTVLMHPLTWMSMRPAFAVYFGVNVAALLGVAAIAQAGVRSPVAKAAVMLGVLALPQTHWALRVGHFTEVLAFSALAGLLLAERRPVLAGVLIAMLALKPQYLPLPLIYLLFTRNWRAFGVATGGLGALAIAGVLAMALREPSGLGMFAYTANYFIEKLPDLARYATIGQGDANYTQSWQYSWYGFLVSLGVDRNPLVAGMLTALSLAAVAAVWLRCSPPVAKVATALGMLLIVPHTTFYNWSMLSVAFALLLHADLRPRWLVPTLAAGVAIAAAATQQATPWPLPVDRYRPAGTDGIYWLQPAVLLSLCIMAVAGKGAAVQESVLRARAVRWTAPARAASWSACGIALAVGAAGAALVTGSGPFSRGELFSRQDVMAALPADFPLPDDASLRDAGPGARLPYRIEWRTDERTGEVAGLMRTRLDDGSWTIVQSAIEDDDPATIELRSARSGTGEPIIVELRIAPSGDGTSLLIEFSPLPATLVPRYEEWLESIGLVVHNVDPSVADR